MSIDNWKNQIDKYLNEENVEQRQLDQEWKNGREERERAKKQEVSEKKQLELEKNQQNLAKTQCNVCRTPSIVPKHIPEKKISTYQSAGYGTQTSDDTYGEITIEAHDDWSKPGDLIECETCKNWTCINHLYKGFCKNCWSVITNIPLDRFGDSFENLKKDDSEKGIQTGLEFVREHLLKERLIEKYHHNKKIADLSDE